MKDYQFPVKYYENNILFNQGNEPWSYYELIGYEYDYLSDSKKVMISRRLELLFAQIEVDTHLLILPKFHSVKDNYKQFKKTITGPLKEQAHSYIDDVIPVIQNVVGTEANDYRFYFGVKLPKQNDVEITIKNIKAAFKDAFREIFVAMGIEDPDIPEIEIKQAQTLENLYFNIISKNILTRRIDEMDYQWLIRRNFYRGIGMPPIIKGFKPGYKKTKNGRKPMDILKLSEGMVDAVTEPRKLLISQAVDGEQKTGHCAFLTMSYIPTDGLFNIHTEWLYAVQTLDFPVDVSIRSKVMDQAKVKTMVRNKKLELNDQEEHATSNNNETSIEVEDNIALVRELEAFTKDTKMPELLTTINIGVYAETAEDLTIRIRSVKALYDNFNIELEQPISDQFKLFNEFIPGADQYVQAYKQLMEPAALAAGMFGATTQVGDSTGFCIGTQGSDKPVYLNPRNYTQGLKGTKSRSLSSIFIGSKGSGKSYGANAVLYLSTVLGGAKSLIIDPKGDRTYWKETLLGMGHEVNVITLEATEENKGRLDPFAICASPKEAEQLALKICMYLTKIHQQKERGEWISIRNAIREVAEGEKPCMDKVISHLLEHPEGSPGNKIGTYLETYQDLSFATLLFGDGEKRESLSIDQAINILQIQNLKMPKAHKKIDDYDSEEMLSMAMMFPIGEFAHDFIKYDSSVMKIVFIDESWFMEKTDIGEDIVERLLREGRAKNAGVFRATQTTKDVDTDTRSLVGLKFVFQNSDPEEAKKSLEFLGIEPTEQLIEQVQNLEVGQCFFQDIYGRTGIIQLRAWFKDLHHAFDTRPPIEREETESMETPIERELVHS